MMNQISPNMAYMADNTMKLKPAIYPHRPTAIEVDIDYFSMPC